MTVFIEEALFRADPEVGLVYHIVLAERGVMLDGSPRLDRIGPLNMSQAEALGYGLPATLAAINCQMLIDLDAGRANAAALQDQLDSNESEAATLRADVARLLDQAGEYAAQISTLTEQLQAAQQLLAAAQDAS